MARFEHRSGLISIALAGMLWMSCAQGTSADLSGAGGSSSVAASSGTGGPGGMGSASASSSSGAGGACNCAAGHWCSSGNCLPCDTPQHCGTSCADCTATGSLCDNGACVECVLDTDCDPAHFCNAGTCAPCDTGQHCGPSCMACTGTTPDCMAAACVCNATSCDPNQVCTSGICETCKTDAACGPTCSACSAPAPFCLDEGTTSQCVECLMDTDCPSGQMCTSNHVCGDPCTLSGKSYDFEADDQGFTHAPTSGLAGDDPWVRGFPSAPACHGGMNCWATNLSIAGYLDCQMAELVSPVIDLSACAGLPDPITLSFWHYYEFEPQSMNRWYDGGVLQLSADGGMTWTDATTSQPYEGLIDGDYQTCTPVPDIGGHQGWSGTIPGGMWVEVSVDVAAMYRVPGFRVRWLFGADGGLTDRGWLIDDVAVTVN